MGNELNDRYIKNLNPKTDFTRFTMYPVARAPVQGLMKHWLNINEELQVFSYGWIFFSRSIPNPGFEEGISFPLLSL